MVAIRKDYLQEVLEYLEGRPVREVEKLVVYMRSAQDVEVKPLPEKKDGKNNGVPKRKKKKNK